MNYERIALIPAYKPDAAFTDVVREAANAGFTVIAVNDGSGTEFDGVFEEASSLATILTHPQNRGKGAAIKTGIQYISEMYKSDFIVVTLDADGQHKVSDALSVLRACEERPDALILGSREFKGNVPLRSRFGNNTTRIVYKIATGVSIRDTQTGLRAFSDQLADAMQCISGERYEYEMNVLLECARRNTPIIEITIETIYLGQNESSHFHAVRDSFRVYKEIIKFFASSFTCFLIDYAAYMLFVWIAGLMNLAGGLTIANIAARVISAGSNYAINRNLVFHSKSRVARSAAEYFALAAAILIGNTMLLNLLAQRWGMNQYLAKLLTEIVFFTISWLCQRHIIFKKKGASDDSKA
ncbi:MAG: bifunctional glycosyltransferase family 2/GtrA family protein [Clostridia bacterium]|nr:bifunctional glycosyltransferase family 2/GtrA family protein [Clostridia bacterium]